MDCSSTIDRTRPVPTARSAEAEGPIPNSPGQERSQPTVPRYRTIPLRSSAGEAVDPCPGGGATNQPGASSPRASAALGPCRTEILLPYRGESVVAVPMSPIPSSPGLSRPVGASDFSGPLANPGRHPSRTRGWPWAGLRRPVWGWTGQLGSRSGANMGSTTVLSPHPGSSNCRRRNMNTPPFRGLCTNQPSMCRWHLLGSCAAPPTRIV